MRELNKIREKVVIRLDNQQVAFGIIGFILVSVVTFSSGVFVGKQMSSDLPESLVSETADSHALEGHAEFKSRESLLTRVGLGTRAVHDDLLMAPVDVVASHPTHAAMIETHKQLAAIRARGVARSLGPVGVTKATHPAPALGLEHVVHRDPVKERLAMAAVPATPTTFALQVSAFTQPAPASVMVDELKKSGHNARIRQVANTYSVEVGRFADASQATRFQRNFERHSGYPTILIPIR
jgi:cell division septation protein DedD